MEDIIIIIIPEWLLWEILIRLPPKCVLRCKLVCKEWGCLISNPLFVGSYVSCCQQRPSWTMVAERMIHYRGNKELSFVQVKLPEKGVTWSTEDFGLLRSIPNIETWHDYKVFGASNGLILVGKIYDLLNGHYISPNTYFLCNPFTGESISLPRPQTEPESLEVDSEQYWGPIGLLTRVVVGAAVLESYRVVLSLPQTTGGRLRFGVYASESQEWKEFVLPPSEHILRVVPATLDNRILHWVTTDGSVIAYDPYDDRVRIIAPPPNNNEEEEEEEEEFIAYASDEGELTYLEFFLQSLRFKLWVLKPSGWSLSRESAIRADHRMLFPMFFNPSDTDILYLADEYGLVSCHVKTGELEVVLKYNTGQPSSCYTLYPCANAFLVQVSPCWPVSLQQQHGWLGS